MYFNTIKDINRIKNDILDCYELHNSSYAGVVYHHNNYWSKYNNTLPVLIGGCVGIAPIFNLHLKLTRDNNKHILIYCRSPIKKGF